jgi:hypothetical protein
VKEREKKSRKLKGKKVAREAERHERKIDKGWMQRHYGWEGRSKEIRRGKYGNTRG